MQRTWTTAACGTVLAVALAITVPAGSNAEMAASLHPLPFANAPQVTGLRLIDAGDPGHAAPRLLVATQPPDGGGMTIVEVAPAGPAQPPQPLATVERNAAWDATHAHGGIAIVSSQAGSAISALVWQTAGQPGHQRVNRRNGFGVFGVPHYIKHDTEALVPVPVPVTSVALGGGASRLVVFPPEGDGGYGALRVLEAPPNGELVDARIVRSGAGYLLAAKFALPGAGRPERYGPDSETVLPGRIECVLLNASLQPDGRVWQPFPGLPVFEFDLDAVGDGGGAILATVASGAVLSATARASARPELTEFRSATPLSSPAVLAEGATLHLALLDAAGSPGAAILVTQLAAGTP